MSEDNVYVIKTTKTFSKGVECDHLQVGDGILVFVPDTIDSFLGKSTFCPNPIIPQKEPSWGLLVEKLPIESAWNRERLVFDIEGVKTILVAKTLGVFEVDEPILTCEDPYITMMDELMNADFHPALQTPSMSGPDFDGKFYVNHIVPTFKPIEWITLTLDVT